MDGAWHFIGYRAIRRVYRWVPTDRYCYVHMHTEQVHITDSPKLGWPWLRSYPEKSKMTNEVEA